MDEAAYERGSADPIPERRPPEKQMRALMAAGDEEDQETAPDESAGETGRTLRYCRVCGYVVFREEPPYVCPICRAKREMFAEIETGLDLRST